MEVERAMAMPVSVVCAEPLLCDAVVSIAAASGLTVSRNALEDTLMSRVGEGTVAIIDCRVLGEGVLPVIPASVSVLAFRGGGELDEVEAVMRWGARGYLTLHATEEELLAAIAAVGRGERHLDGLLASGLADRLLTPATVVTRGVLTPRERDVLRLAASGQTTAEIGQVLFISPTTVKTHLHNAYAKLGVRSRSAAIARLATNGELDVLLSTAA